MDFLGLCREIRVVYPDPVKLDVLTKFLEDKAKDLNQEQFNDLLVSLTKFWKRKGWFLDPSFAILLEEGEEALFHDKGITVIRVLDSLPDQVLLMQYPLGQKHEKVIWF